jgi:Protein of unknown function (DUF3489)
LLFFGTRVIHVVTRITAEGETTMTTLTTEQPATGGAAAPAEEPNASSDKPKATKKAKGGEKGAKGAPAKAKSSKKASPAKKAPKSAKTAKPTKAEAGPREGSKTAQVVALLQRKNGATISEIMEKMGWQKHTVRGFMAGAMKKAGYTVESFKSDKGERTYRINA